MNSKKPPMTKPKTESLHDTAERIVKEYPNTTRRLEGNRTIGAGNLILTSERLIFLNRVQVTERVEQKLKELTDAPTSRILNYALTMHKNNFQIPLSSVQSFKRHVFAYLPIPRFCLRISYHAKQQKPKTADFAFTISILKGFFQLEFTVVQAWIWVIKRELKLKNENLKT